MDSLNSNSIPVRSVPIKAGYVNLYRDQKRTSIEPHISYEDLLQQLINLLQLDRSITEDYTVKWIDEEGDPCTIASKKELDEAIRLFILSQEKELQIHVFPGIPKPGDFCAGESTKFYERKGARRWKKNYRVMGHSFAPRRFSFKVECPICRDSIWGIGRQGFKCINCKTLLHKRCCRYITEPCPGYPLDHQHVISPTPDRLNNIKHDFSVPDPGPIIPPGGITLDDFDLMAVIGRGSYAKVLMVKLKSTQKTYAMKIIKKSIIDDEDDIEWVQTEKNVFEQASNHPFLVGLHSCFQTTSRIVFVIEFVNGGDMMFHMQKLQRLEEDHARFYAAEISCALHYLHDHLIIYRDLKLDNVLIDSEGHIKLTDYGMCKECSVDDQTTGTFCGTPNYIAPEVLKGGQYSYSVDWWALGVLLYEMLCGRSPFNVDNQPTDNPEESENLLFQCILTKPVRIPRALSVKAGSVLKYLLRRDPEERLGCNKEQGFNQIKQHPFFNVLDWDLLESRQVTPPYIPPIAAEDDLANFDRAFTDEAVQLTPDDPDELARINQSEFEGFEYINPLLLNKEEAV
ncbi:hypothetical protein ACHWQZ_G017905 [Mnemiopsis leidyi]